MSCQEDINLTWLRDGGGPRWPRCNHPNETPGPSELSAAGREGGQKQAEEADRPHSEKVKERRKTQESSHSKAGHQDNQGGMGSGEGRGGLNQTRKTQRSLARVKMLRTNVPRAGPGICATHGLGTE